MSKYEVLCDFVTLFSLKRGEDAYRKMNALQDTIKIALKSNHIKVKGINMRIVRRLKGE